MKSFIGTFVNKIDAKGRISVPAPFRNVLQQKGLTGVTCYPSITGTCIEGCGIDRIEAMVDMLPDEPIPGLQEDSIAHLIFASARDLPFDTGGRIVLPLEFINEAKLHQYAAFVGKGRTFQIWEPQELKRIQKELLTLAIDQRKKLEQAKGV
ncbi:MAG: division/cell wall cluster transcriptional repressor MraZ [Rhodospirillaceae bacterium]|nr:division/cell wall cluster transcriptional repressor MraZ [Rhodospirillaceae bacterium]